ncbi:MAG: N-acetylneuraminate synthase [Candidatus Omnitrophota bacterium]|nr:MAG: N-acetylneuraminate synthase [Candidatus Omnitrophota bacterium]
MRKTFVIAEAGVNHNGSIKIAKKMIDAAVLAGADAVKFQTFEAEKLVTKSAPMAEYQKKATGESESQFEMIKRLELDKKAHQELMKHCKKRGILFLSSPFDLESIEFLNRLGLEVFKVASGEITNVPFLRKIGTLRKKIIISTGMADLKEIENALCVLIKAGTPKENITLLHCNTEYPTPFEDVNLSAMLTIRDAFKVRVGYSDHTPGIEIPIAAAVLGASVIEKHFTLDKNMQGPDHRASLEPDDLGAMVKAIRHIEKALGSRIKKPSPSEIKNRRLVRKSIVASRFIKKGELLTQENITTKRPATGISPMSWDKVIAQKAKRNFKKDESLEL